MPSEPPSDLIPEGPLAELYKRRRRANADLVTIVSDWHNRRGTGKTILSLRLAHMMDGTEEGITREKCSLSPEELMSAYVEEERGSALLLDEAEAGIGNRSSMTNVNKAMRKLLSMGRIEEKYLIVNAPASSHIDKAVRELADVWIVVTRKGHARVFFLKYNPFQNSPYTDEKQTLEWTDIPTSHPLREVYQQLTKDKRSQLREGDAANYVPLDEHEEKVEKAREKASMEKRNELIRQFYARTDDLTQGEVGEIVDLGAPRINEIVNS